ncbi:MAG: winged helix-turn-helix transcriptional regulator [Methanomassiliicoccales archaeon]
MKTENVQFRNNGIRHSNSGNSRSKMLSGNRKEVLSVIFNYPASSISRIAREVKLTPNTVKWHLSSLLRNEFINEERVENRAIYYPVDFVDRQEIAMLSLLNFEDAGKIFTYVFHNPGRSQKEIREALNLTQNTAGYFLRKLVHSGLLEERQDGKFKHYAPSPLFMQKTEERNRRKNDVLGRFVQKMRNEGYEIMEQRADGNYIIFRFRLRRTEETIKICMNPFDNLLGMSAQ